MRGRHGERSQWWHGRCIGHWQRLTLPREAILDVLSKTKGHLSADDIYTEVSKVYPMIGLTTVYRTLESLVDMGVVNKFDFGDDRSRYELAIGPQGIRHHHHLVCTQCGKIIDYTEFIDDEVELLTRTEKGLSQKYNFIITNHTIQFFGLCQECQKKK